MSLLKQNAPVFLNVLHIIIMLSTDCESVVLRIRFGMDIAHEGNIDKEVDRSSIGKNGIQDWKEVKNMSVEKAIGSSSLVEVIDRILDKGVVVDAWVRVSLVGIEILAVEARVVVASVETYLKYAEAIGLTATAA